MASHCWEQFQCTNRACPAHENPVRCWLVSKTHCRDAVQGEFLEKAEICLECPVFFDRIEPAEIKQTFGEMYRQFQSYKTRFRKRDEDLQELSVELAIGLSEVIAALQQLAAGDPDVRISEQSKVDLLAVLKQMVNHTAGHVKEMVATTHEIAIGLAEHFDVMHRVTLGDRSARVTGKSNVELLEALKRMTNKTIESVDREIAERRQAERTVRRSEALLRTVIDSNPCCIHVKDELGRFLLANKAIAELYDTTPTRMVGRTEETLAELAGIDLQEVKLPEQVVTRSGQPKVLTEWCVRRPEQDPRWFELLRTPLTLSDDGFCVLGVAVEITERKAAAEEKHQLETWLQQAHKMEAIGTLAGGIAHDFNNILGVMIGFAEIAKMRQATGADVTAELDTILQSARRASDLVKQILTFSRQSRQELMPIQVGPVIKEVLKLLRASLPTTVEIRSHLEARESFVRSDPVQVHQVLMNLCTNAAHAMQENGGVLTVSTEEVVLSEEASTLHPDLKPGPHVKLTVADTGDGIDPAIIGRIFEPFFTTKERNVGTGMGLAMVHGIIKAHGGAVLVKSTVEGTSFQVHLPSIKASVEDDLESQKSIPGGIERILFIDDEPSLARLGYDTLSHLGYRVKSVTSSTQALDLFRDEPHGYDLVITDLTMPQMTGLQLAAQLQRLRQNIPIILCTGFADEIAQHILEQQGIRRLLYKPLLLEQLARTIREVLSE